MPATAAPTADPGDATHGPGPARTPDEILGSLLDQMNHKSGFPALSEALPRIVQGAGSDREHLADLTDAILRDSTLTQRLLRLVNSVHFAHLDGGDGVGTISRAVALIGFDAVRVLALSLVLLNQTRDKGLAEDMRDEFVRALMAGTLADEINVRRRERESAFIAAMFQNLGRMLASFYFPPQARAVRGLLAEEGFAGGDEAAAAAVFGVGFDALGDGVAQRWGLPRDLRRSMRRPAEDPPGVAPAEAADRLRWTGAAANAVVDALTEIDDPALLDERMRALAQRYAGVVGLDADAFGQLADRARDRLAPLTRAMGVQAAPGSVAARLLRKPDPATFDPAAAAAARTLAVARRSGQGASAELLAGARQVEALLAEGGHPPEAVLQEVLQTIYDALGFRRVVFCLREAAEPEISARFGLGEGLGRAMRALRVPLRDADDLFAAVCLKGADLQVSDATDRRMARRLPDWYRRTLNAPSFLLLPVRRGDRAHALIYADHADPGGIALGGKELEILRGLRDQAARVLSALPDDALPRSPRH